MARSCIDKRRQRGAASVELTLAIPIFIVLFAVLVHLGVGMTAKGRALVMARHAAWHKARTGQDVTGQDERLGLGTVRLTTTEHRSRTVPVMNELLRGKARDVEARLDVDCRQTVNLGLPLSFSVSQKITRDNWSSSASREGFEGYLGEAFRLPIKPSKVFRFP